MGAPLSKWKNEGLRGSVRGSSFGRGKARLRREMGRKEQGRERTYLKIRMPQGLADFDPTFGVEH